MVDQSSGLADPAGSPPTRTELSQAALDRLKAEHEDLTTRGRVELAATIERARELGDLSENADYHSAKDDQGRMEARIRHLHRLIETAVVIEDVARTGSGAVISGSIVTLRYSGAESAEKYLVGSIEERRDDVVVVSPASPLGKAILGHRAGETVEYEAPRGMLSVEVIEVA
ncbi:MAG: GreA/GreB family elongation factor [Acidimicrobiales bacterium]